MEQEKIWEYYQNEAIESFEGSKGRLSYLLKNIKPNSKVLNIGVGGGIFEIMAIKEGIDIYSLDPDKSAITNLRDRLNIDENKAKVGYSQEIPFPDNTFDYVVMSEVIEHLTDEIISDSLKEVKRVLKEDGNFIGTVPSREDLKAQEVICPCCANKFHRWGHVQSFTPVSLDKLLSKTFTVEKIIEKSFITWESLNYKGKTVAMIKSILSNLGIHGSGENIYFCVKKTS
ncbi:class I SAM-dependent methyltransferase [Bacillus sp. Marseille-P3661]|uniref:class I SAM-dependent methyltransferase n=1 Tax=Bacillus sp. Marseille-P3661 TaxID=1936234 RepID=UPI000C831C3E|nr:class I SAM-dependent methyltransferase [Bacillus sp. Marseille-P3661]